MRSFIAALMGDAPEPKAVLHIVRKVLVTKEKWHSMNAIYVSSVLKVFLVLFIASIYND